MDKDSEIRERTPWFPVLCFFLVLFLLGALTFYGGCKAIGARHLESAWEQDGGFQIAPLGIGAHHAAGVDKFDGPEAVRVGTGLALFGGMLALWAMLGFWGMVRPSRWAVRGSAAACLTAVSLVLLTGSLACVLPPWRAGAGIGPAMWGTMIVGGVYALVFRMRGLKHFFTVLVLLTLVGLLFFGGRWPAGVALAIFAGIAFAAHGVLLWAWLRKDTGEIPVGSPPKGPIPPTPAKSDFS